MNTEEAYKLGFVEALASQNITADIVDSMFKVARYMRDRGLHTDFDLQLHFDINKQTGASPYIGVCTDCYEFITAVAHVCSTVKVAYKHKKRNKTLVKKTATVTDKPSVHPLATRRRKLLDSERSLDAWCKTGFGFRVMWAARSGLYAD